MAPFKRPIKDRYLEYLPEAPDANGCLIWRGPVTGSGYGALWVDGKYKGAHRLSVEFSGRSIPEGYHVDHLCRVPMCVNPDHLEPVTPGENIRRGETFARANMLKTHCPQGHKLSGDNLDQYALRGGHRSCRECGRQRCREWHFRNREKRLATMKEYKKRAKEGAQ